MLGASKILTVSYGTFSCTLEGFDEPFSTMKAIAEYFRDLAAEDRYFGAEPPTPDAAMLHRIAEREIQRRVEAKVQENGVILRAGDEGSAFAPAAPVVAPLLDAAPAPAESAAEKLRRLRGEAAALPVAAPQPEAPHVAASAPVLAAEYEEDTPLAEMAAPLAFDDDFGAPADTAPAAESDFGADPGYGADLETAAAVLPASAPEEEAEPEAVRAEALEEEFVEDLPEPAPEAVLDAVEDDAAMLAALGAMDLTHAAAELDAEPEAELAAELAPELADSLPEDLDWDEAEEDETAAMLAALVDPLPEDRPAALQDDVPGLADMIDPEGFDAEDGFDAEEAEASTGTEALEAAELVAAPSAQPALAEDDEAPDESEPAPVSDKAQRARARVIRIRRSDAPAPVAEAEPAPAPAAMPLRASLLSPEAEAALQAELAALEAEIGATEPEAAPVAAPAKAAEPAAPAETEPRRRLDSGADDSVSRLIARTDSEMEGEDTRRRRSAIEHLKAAVAATTAERQIHGPAPERGEARKDAYRADLEQAVRPQRAEGERLSPLVLVSEQRIDRPRSTTSTAALSVASDNAAETVAAPVTAPVAAPGPVRPRRVKAGRHAAAAALQSVAEAAPEPELARAELLQPAPKMDLPSDADLDADDLDEEDDDEGNVFSDSKSFGDFAERLGATQLPDLIEAAAVYCAMVLKRPEFSRPLVLRQVAELPAGAGLAREDCLRSFGSLMRKGRITKVRAGHFAVTQRSPLLAEALRNAG